MNKRANRQRIIQSGDVIGFHADAPVTRRPPDISLFRRAVNINAAAERVRVLRLETAKPDNSCDNWIPSNRIRTQDLDRKPAIMKDSPIRSMIANLCAITCRLLSGVVIRPPCKIARASSWDVETG